MCNKHIFCFTYGAWLSLQGSGLDSHSRRMSSQLPSVRWASSPRRTHLSMSSRAFSGTHQGYLLSSFHSLIWNLGFLHNITIAKTISLFHEHSIYINILVLFNTNSMQLRYFCLYQHKYLYYLQHFFSPYHSLIFLRDVFKLIHINIWFE